MTQTISPNVDKLSPEQIFMLYHEALYTIMTEPASDTLQRAVKLLWDLPFRQLMKDLSTMPEAVQEAARAAFLPLMESEQVVKTANGLLSIVCEDVYLKLKACRETAEADGRIEAWGISLK